MRLGGKVSPMTAVKKSQIERTSPPHPQGIPCMRYFARDSALARMKKDQPEVPEQSLSLRWMKIAGVVTLYWVVSISMVFINKYLLSNKDLKLEAPLFITLSQCVVAVTCFSGLGSYSLFYPNTISFPPFEAHFGTAIKVLPLSIVFVGMIVFNNFTLKYLGIAFYNVGRSLTTVFNVSLSYVILRQGTSLRAIVCCGAIIGGFLLGLKEENQSLVGVSISWLGVASGVTASLCVALYAIFTKRTLQLVGENIWRLQFYNNLNAVAILVLLTLLMECSQLREFKHWVSPYFWFPMLAAGVFGIAIGYVTSLQIQVTSPLTHNVSGTAKACAQTILACLVFADSKGFWWWVSNAMVLGGSSGYTYVRMGEMKANQEKNNQQLVILEEGESEG